MAEKKGERRMLFDTRGRRRNVIRVVYAVLALLMGGSLFLTVGPFSIGEFLNTGSSSDAADVFHEQAERIEERLAKDPTDAALLVSLTRARINAGNAQVETDPQTGAPGEVTPDARDDYDKALEAWNRYRKQVGGEPNPSVAQLVAITFFRLAESSGSLLESEERIATATAAQEIAAERRPNAGTLTTLAIYQYFNGEFAAGDKSTKRAAGLVPSKAEVKNLEKQMTEYRQNAKQFDRQKKQLAKVQEKVGEEQGGNPFGNFGAGTPAPSE